MNMKVVAKKKKISLYICLLCLTSLLSGCGKKEEVTPVVEEPVVTEVSEEQVLIDTYAKQDAFKDLNLPVINYYEGRSIIEALEKNGYPSDFEYRKQLASKLGMNEYSGTEEENLKLIEVLNKYCLYLEKVNEYQNLTNPEVDENGEKHNFGEWKYYSDEKEYRYCNDCREHEYRLHAYQTIDVNRIERNKYIEEIEKQKCVTCGIENTITNKIDKSTIDPNHKHSYKAERIDYRYNGNNTHYITIVSHCDECGKTDIVNGVSPCEFGDWSYVPNGDYFERYCKVCNRRDSIDREHVLKK